MTHWLFETTILKFSNAIPHYCQDRVLLLLACLHLKYKSGHIAYKNTQYTLCFIKHFRSCSTSVSVSTFHEAYITRRLALLYMFFSLPQYSLQSL